MVSYRVPVIALISSDVVLMKRTNVRLLESAPSILRTRSSRTQFVLLTRPLGLTSFAISSNAAVPLTSSMAGPDQAETPNRDSMSEDVRIRRPLAAVADEDRLTSAKPCLSPELVCRVPVKV